MLDHPKTNVLFLLSSLKIRGAERMLINLVNRLDRNRFSPFVLSLSDQNPLACQLDRQSVKFFVSPRKWRGDVHPAEQIRKIIVEDQIDSIVIHDIFCYFFLWIALSKVQLKPKILISIHNIRYLGWKDFVKNWLICRLLTGNEIFVSVCNAQADWWSKTYSIPKDRFYTIYNGVDTEYFAFSNSNHQKLEARSKLDLPDDAFIILQLASMTSEKRHEDALAAFQIICQKTLANNFLLIFVGDGPRREFLQTYARQLGLTNRVIFCGVKNTVKEYYAAADLFTLTSSSETFSMAALEAMAMGLPSVITDVGGAREMIVENMNGYFVEPYNPSQISAGWLKVYNNRKQFHREEIRELAVQRFSLSECTRQYERIISL